MCGDVYSVSPICHCKMEHGTEVGAHDLVSNGLVIAMPNDIIFASPTHELIGLTVLGLHTDLHIW